MIFPINKFKRAKHSFRHSRVGGVTPLWGFHRPCALRGGNPDWIPASAGMTKHRCWAMLGILLIPLFLGAENPPVKAGRIRPIYPITIYSIIDSPNAEVADYGSFAFSTRFFSKGGILPSLSFGVFQRLMLGATLEMENYIGNDSVDLQEPKLQIKFRAYDGSQSLPAIAIGYDGQGYHFDKATKKYAEQERGLYAVFTQEILLRGLETSAGLNISDFNTDQIRLFINSSLVVSGAVGLFLEYDNVQNLKYNRFNAGTTLFMSPSVQMGFHVRDIFHGDHYKNSSLERTSERIIDIRYMTNF